MEPEEEGEQESRIVHLYPLFPSLEKLGDSRGKPPLAKTPPLSASPFPFPLSYMTVRLATKIEAILYLKGQPLSIAQIADYAQCDRALVEEGIIELIDEYAHRESALEVVETANGYSLQLRNGFQNLVQTLIPVELGVGALRTLAAIALHNPITQSELVNVRGSGAYQHVQELIELGFIRKRRQADCRSLLLHITDKFHFSLSPFPFSPSLIPGAFFSKIS